MRVSVCHCLACQQRTGSAFGVQARWPQEQVKILGSAHTWSRTADSGNQVTYRFCPQCGSTLAYSHENWPGLIAVPVGAFADPNFPAPCFSVYEHRKHEWTLVLGPQVEHSASSSAVRAPAPPKSQSP